MRRGCIRHAGRNAIQGSGQRRPLLRSLSGISPPTPPPVGLPPRQLPPRLAAQLPPQLGGAAPRASIHERKREAIKAKRLALRDSFTETGRLRKRTGGLGATQNGNEYRPDGLLKNPPTPSDVTLEMLMANQTHMGHSTPLWNPENSRYILGVRQGIHIISLEETASHLRRAARVVEEIVYRAGLVLFVGNRPGQSQIVARASSLAGACRLWTKWAPGSITNAGMLLGASTGSVLMVDEHDEPVVGLDAYLPTAPPLVPDLVIVLNPLENGPLLHECSLVNVPTIGIIDTDADPTKVTYSIPANDDSLRSTAVIALVLGSAGAAGKKRRLADAALGKVAWRTKFDIEKAIKDSNKKQDGDSLDEGQLNEDSIFELRRELSNAGTAETDTEAEVHDELQDSTGNAAVSGIDTGQPPANEELSEKHAEIGGINAEGSSRVNRTDVIQTEQVPKKEEQVSAADDIVPEERMVGVEQVAGTQDAMVMQAQLASQLTQAAEDQHVAHEELAKFLSSTKAKSGIPEGEKKQDTSGGPDGDEKEWQR